MSLFMIFKSALGAIRRNKVRSFLTCVGIIIGIAAVILVLSLGKGAKYVMVRQFEELGINLILISPNQHRAGEVSGGGKQGETLTAADAEAIERELRQYVSGVSPVVSASCQLVYENRNWSVGVLGVDTGYPAIRNHFVGDGAFFTAEDMRRARRVCVIGTTIRDNLFGEGVDPVGRTIRIKDMPFRVVGLLQHKGLNTAGQDQDDTVLLPYTTADRVLQGSVFKSVGFIVLSAQSMDTLAETKAAVRALLRRRHRLRARADDDFEIQDATQVVETIQTVLGIITILLTVVAAISLGVGGIGIMNIMLVSVTERIKEIGLRMAIGAHPSAILGQFVIEAVTLSSFGGLAGVATGGGLAMLLVLLVGCPNPVEVQSAVIAFSVSVAVGVFFGFYPAYRASKLSPIQCLRNE